MRKGDTILDSLERIWRQTQPMDSGIRVASYKRCNRRLLDQVFKLKPIKREVKSHFDSPRNHLNSKATPQTICLPKTQITIPIPWHLHPEIYTFPGN